MEEVTQSAQSEGQSSDVKPIEPKSKRIMKITSRVLTWVVLAFAVFMMIFTIISVSTFDNKDRGIFGYKAFIVLSDSMAATDFKKGDLIFCKEVDVKTLEEGDIITFQSTNPDDSYGEIITHKIRRVVTDNNGNVSFVTYGTTTDSDDLEPVTENFVIGQYKGKMAGVGKFFQFLKTTPGYIVCILLPFLALILMQGWNSIRVFRRYKQEQKAEMQAEKDKLEAERVETQKMMAELLALRTQMASTQQASAEGAEEKKSEDGTTKS